MEQIVNLQKTIPNKDKIDNLIDREFKFFVSNATVEPVATIEPFFQMYEDLYFQIPAEGETNSHEYLIRRSSEIFQLGQDVANLQPLLDEISDLRVQLLEASNRIFDLENQLNGN